MLFEKNITNVGSLQWPSPRRWPILWMTSFSVRSSKTRLSTCLGSIEGRSLASETTQQPLFGDPLNGCFKLVQRVSLRLIRPRGKSRKIELSLSPLGHSFGAYPVSSEALQYIGSWHPFLTSCTFPIVVCTHNKKYVMMMIEKCQISLCSPLY